MCRHATVVVRPPLPLLPDHPYSSVFVYKNRNDGGYYSWFPHKDTQRPKPKNRPLHSTCDSIF